jgi:hypothetical protein
MDPVLAISDWGEPQKSSIIRLSPGKVFNPNTKQEPSWKATSSYSLHEVQHMLCVATCLIILLIRVSTELGNWFCAEVLCLVWRKSWRCTEDVDFVIISTSVNMSTQLNAAKIWDILFCHTHQRFHPTQIFLWFCTDMLFPFRAHRKINHYSV